MPVPKKKTSRMKKGFRRSHDRLDLIQNLTCSECGEFKLPHRVCGKCGSYKNKEIISIS